MRKIFVLGSINMDLVISVTSIPEIGESKNGHSFMQNQGGKGANQAVACKKLGSDDVRLIACVGKDENGKALIASMKQYGINTDLIKVKEEVSSGVCMIILDEEKQDNMLIIDRGANDAIEINDFEKYLRKNASKDDIFITQLEVNLNAVYDGLKIAKEIGMFTILNPAPVTEFNKECLKNVDLIIPNETEAKLLTGISTDLDSNLLEIYKYFFDLGVKEMIVTLGSRGSCYIKDNNLIFCPSFRVEAVDTTSAGDTFIGAVAMRIASGFKIEESLSFASKCSSITVSRKGAAISIPTKEEVKNFM